MKKVIPLLLSLSFFKCSLLAQSPFPLPLPLRPTNFPLSLPPNVLFGNEVRTFGTIFEWRSSDNDIYTALIPLAPPQSFPENVRQIAEGSAFSAALKKDGTVFTWGQDFFGYGNLLRSFLENFTNASQLQIARTSEFVGSELAAAVLLDDGTVGQFGLALPDGTQLPQPADLGQVIQIALGLRHIVALKSDGTVVTWGVIADGISGPNEPLPQSPNYTYCPASTLVPANMTNVVQVVAAFHHAFALRSDGTVVGWGYRMAEPWFLLPAYVPPGLTDVVQIATSETITAALKSDGTVSVWAFTNSIPPEYSYVLPPSGLTNVVKVSVGNGHGMALVKDGTVRSWGRYARPRDGAVDESIDPLVNSIPADSSNWTNIIDISAGNESGYGLVWDGLSGLPPKITRAVRQSGTFVLEWSDPMNRPVHVQRRTSLSSGAWSNISTNVISTQFIDSSPPPGAAFYRLVAP